MFIEIDLKYEKQNIQ